MADIVSNYPGRHGAGRIHRGGCARNPLGSAPSSWWPLLARGRTSSFLEAHFLAAIRGDGLRRGHPGPLPPSSSSSSMLLKPGGHNQRDLKGGGPDGPFSPSPSSGWRRESWPGSFPRFRNRNTALQGSCRQTFPGARDDRKQRRQRSKVGRDRECHRPPSLHPTTWCASRSPGILSSVWRVVGRQIAHGYKRIREMLDRVSHPTSGWSSAPSYSAVGTLSEVLVAEERHHPCFLCIELQLNAVKLSLVALSRVVGNRRAAVIRLLRDEGGRRGSRVGLAILISHLPALTRP